MLYAQDAPHKREKRSSQTMGLIRKIRDGDDPWSVRLEEQRKTGPWDVPDEDGEVCEEDAEVLRRRGMFGKVFASGPPE